MSVKVGAEPAAGPQKVWLEWIGGPMTTFAVALITTTIREMHSRPHHKGAAASGAFGRLGAIDGIQLFVFFSPTCDIFQ